MKKTFLILAPLMLTACVPVRHATLLPQLEGKPLSAAVSRFGQPRLEIRQGGAEDVHVWVHDETWQTVPPDQGPDISVVGKNVVYHHRVMPLSQTTYTWECRLEITTDKEKITGARYWGDPPACDYFRDKMTP